MTRTGLLTTALLSLWFASALPVDNILEKLRKGRFSNDVENGKTLFVHVVPHTHDDVGWLKTPEQYYYGFNNTIQSAAVRYILDTTIASLLQNPNRTFTYVEVYFFSKWWYEQSDETKVAVRSLVGSGQLSFANGGWCMHDEAATHYVGMIDQTSLGHNFLKTELGVAPKVGWQLDPFGHSATQAGLLSSRVGFDSIYFGRIDYQDLRRRWDDAQCEGYWSASPENLGDDATVFWGLTGSFLGNYGPPAGFCFDVHCDEDYLIGQDEDILMSRLTDLTKSIKVQSDRTRGSHIMLTMGEDFNYENAFVQFENIDFMITELLKMQNDGRIDVASILGPRFDRFEIFYSNPEKYTQAKHDEFVDSPQKLGYETKTDDFFPYSDRSNGFWTGYFSSRPALKRLERFGSSFLLAARQILALRSDDTADCLFPLEEAMGIAQHHDAVSGTSKQHVANDYAKKIHAGISGVADEVNRVLHDWIFGDDCDTVSNLSFCNLRNETICDISQQASKALGNDIYLLVYNALAHSRDEIVSVPVSVDGPYLVETLVGGDSWGSVESVVFPNANHVGRKEAAEYILYFDAKELNAVGVTLYRIKRKQTETSVAGNELAYRMSFTPALRRMKSEETLMISTGSIIAVLNSKTGGVSKLCEVGGDACLSVHQEWGYYTSFDAAKHAETKEDTQDNSGAYLFRPSLPTENLHSITMDPSKTIVVKSNLVTEIRSESHNGWMKQIARASSGQSYIEFEYTVGPIPIHDGLGKEIVTRYSSGIENNGVFYTDSNGREFIKRERSKRGTWPLEEFQPVAGNYYPVNAAIYIEDNEFALSIMVDRSQGGASLSDGSIELMVHRRILADDSRGVGEPLNETDAGITNYPPYGDASRRGNGLIISGKHRLMLSSDGGAKASRSCMDKTFSPPLLFATNSTERVTLASTPYSLIEKSLPPNVMLLTFAQHSFSSTKIVLRIRLAHQYAKGEDVHMSMPATISFSDLLPQSKIVSIVEKTLSGNMDLYDREIAKLAWHTRLSNTSRITETATLNVNDPVIVIQPMDIRTFEVGVNV